MTSIVRSVIKIVVAMAALALAPGHAPLMAAEFDWKSSNIQGPVPRRGHAMAYDSARGRVVMFGGPATQRGISSRRGSGTATAGSGARL